MDLFSLNLGTFLVSQMTTLISQSVTFGGAMGTTGISTAMEGSYISIQHSSVPCGIRVVGLVNTRLSPGKEIKRNKKYMYNESTCTIEIHEERVKCVSLYQ